MTSTGLIKFAKGFIPMCTLLFAPITFLNATTDQEVAELREMVLNLANEVADLKAQLAEKEAMVPAPAPTPLKPAPMAQKPAPKPAPKPVVANVSSKYGLSFYGYFKLDAMYDSGLSSHQEIPFWVRPETPTNQGSFEMTAKETRLGINFAGPSVSGGDVTGKLEMDFYGNINTPTNLGGNHGYALRTRHAYINWDFGKWSLLAGKTWEPYLIYFPQTLNFGYYNFQGQLGLRKTQLRFTRKVGDNLVLTGALTAPVGGTTGADLDGDLQDDGVDSGQPAISGKAVINFDGLTEKPSSMGVAFVYGREDIDIHPVGGSKDYDAWAVIAAMKLPITDNLTWTGSMFTGSNLDGYWGGIAQGINLARRAEIDGAGGWTQLQYKASDKLHFNLGYSVDDPEDSDLSNGGRTLNESLSVNCFYTFSPAMVFGLEYMRVKTEYKNAKTADNDHVQSSLIYKF